MRKTYALLDIDLQLFDGAAGGAAGGNAGDGTAQGETSALPKAENGRGSSRRAKTGAYDNVVFGKQEDAPQAVTTSPVAGENTAEGNGKLSTVETTSDSLEAKREAFRNLTKGEYKEQFAEEVQGVINRRFKEVKGMETSLTAQKPIMDLLMKRYGIADGDTESLYTAIKNDKTYLEVAAEREGLTTDQFQAKEQLELRNEQLEANERMREEAERRSRGEQQAKQKLSEWYAEAEQLKAIYPAFDFETESQNQNFRGLLRSGVSVQQAYEVMHLKEITANAAKAAAQTAGQQMVAKIQSKASRPSENGTSSQSAAIIKSDVHNLSKNDRAEAARRALRGEKIRW